MQRIAEFTYAEAIGSAMALIEPEIMAMLRHVHFLCGVNPKLAGLHEYTTVPYGDFIADYGVMAHCVYPENCIDSERRTTVVIPSLIACRVDTVVHELGHCLDEVLNFSHLALPVSKYAETNRYEAFAEAFEARYFWYGNETDELAPADRDTVELFNRLVIAR